MNWTRLSNAFWDQKLNCRLPQSELNLFLVIVRLVEGYHRDSVAVGETELLEMTEMSRASLYRAKTKLQEKGLIAVDNSGPVCSYSLGDAMRTKGRRPPPEPEPPTQGGLTGETGLSQEPVSHGRDGGGSHWRYGSRLTDETERGLTRETGPILKENQKEILKESSSSLRSTLNRKNDDVFSKSEINADQAPQDPADQVATQLQAVGVSVWKAQQLSRNHAPDLVLKVLSNARHRKEISNLAGWVVREIEAGGFGPPAAVLANEQREAKLRRAADERQAEIAHRDTEQFRARLEWDHLVGQLSPAEFDQVVQQAREQLPRKMAKATIESGLLRGVVLEILRSRRKQLVS